MERCQTRVWHRGLTEAAEGFADEIAWKERGIEACEGFLGFGSLVAEGEEGKEGVLGMAGDVGGGVCTTWRSSTREGIEGGEFVAEFEDDTFGGFFS